MSDTSTEAREYFIKKNGYYYRPDDCGYTDRPILAGLYTLAEAKATTHPNGEDGPRDGMRYFHESECGDRDYLQFKALAAERDALQEKLDRAAEALTVISNRSMDECGSYYKNRSSIREARATLKEIQEGTKNENG